MIASSKRVRRVALTSSTLGSDISVNGCRVAFSMAVSIRRLARGDEADRVARAAGATGAADAVHVGLGVDRQVVVDDVADALDVETARRDVGRDEDVQLSGLELVDRALALHLGDVAVDRGRGVAAGAQLLGDRLGLVLRAGETIMPSKFSTSRMRVSASIFCWYDTTR